MEDVRLMKAFQEINLTLERLIGVNEKLLAHFDGSSYDDKTTGLSIPLNEYRTTSVLGPVGTNGSLVLGVFRLKQGAIVKRIRARLDYVDVGLAAKGNLGVAYLQLFDSGGFPWWPSVAVVSGTTGFQEFGCQLNQGSAQASWDLDFGEGVQITSNVTLAPLFVLRYVAAAVGTDLITGNFCVYYV